LRSRLPRIALHGSADAARVATVAWTPPAVGCRFAVLRAQFWTPLPLPVWCRYHHHRLVGLRCYVAGYLPTGSTGSFTVLQFGSAFDTTTHTVCSPHSTVLGYGYRARSAHTFALYAFTHRLRSHLADDHVYVTHLHYVTFHALFTGYVTRGHFTLLHHILWIPAFHLAAARLVRSATALHAAATVAFRVRTHAHLRCRTWVERSRLRTAPPPRSSSSFLPDSVGSLRFTTTHGLRLHTVHVYLCAVLHTAVGRFRTHTFALSCVPHGLSRAVCRWTRYTHVCVPCCGCYTRTVYPRICRYGVVHTLSHARLRCVYIAPHVYSSLILVRPERSGCLLTVCWLFC